MEQREALGTFSLRVSEAGINRILDVLAVERRVEIPPLKIDARFLGSLALGGAVTVRDFRVSISGTSASGSAQVLPAFTLTVDLPRLEPTEVPLDVTFRIPEVIAVELKHVGPKAFMVLSDIDLSMDLQAPSIVPKRLWELALGQLGRIKDRVVAAIENQLKKRPIELLDLRKHSDLQFPGDKVLPTRQSFGILEFRDGALHCTIRVDEIDA